MKKKSIYLDTSVISALFDNRTPERQYLTKLFWDQAIYNYNIYISKIVVDELNDVSDRSLRQELLDTVSSLKALNVNQEIRDLANEYVSRSIIPQKHAVDAVHIAIAVFNDIHYLVSWNFKHMVKVKTREQVMLVNSLLGYPILDIVAPPEL